MSARGARSRKAVAKDIEKKEKKRDEKTRAVSSIRRPHDAFAEWAPTPSRSSKDNSAPSRSFTVSSDASRTTSRSSSTNPSHSRPRLNTIRSDDSFDFKAGLRSRPRTSASGSASISESSTKGKEKNKYAAKGGKETKAPRGRGGGVPIKKPAGHHAQAPMFRSETSASYIPPNSKTWINFRIWEGGENGLPPYGGWDYDEHMQTGNVLIYFKEEQHSEDRPIPQIRCDLGVLENSGSTWLSNALLYGRIDDNEDEWTLPGSPESSVPSHGFPHPSGQRKMLGPTSPGGKSPPPFNIDQAYFGVPGNGTASRAQYYSDMDRPGGISPPPFHQGHDIQPTHELWFTSPAHVRTPQGQRLHHVAIRNFLAMLHNKPIVGADLYEMLTTLQPEIQVMYDLDQDSQSRSPRERSVEMITHYLTRHQLDDCRNSVKTALALLAWSEQDTVKWRQGYLESFAHLAGVLSPQIEDLPDFKRLSIVTRRNLAIAAKTLQLRIMEAEEKLSTFDFSDLWGETIKGVGGPVYQSYMGFREFLMEYFNKSYGNWPPAQSKTWLNRKTVLSLQRDFGALYDYLVNRDVSWDSREERAGRKWEMAHSKDANFKADHPGEPSVTDMLVTFDHKHGYLHIPHPYPLLPREVAQTKKVEKKGFFKSLKKEKADVKGDAKAHLQLSIIFSDATNIERMDGQFSGSTLIDQFERFELSSDIKHITPREARLGRWILLYGVLQVLSTLSVDVRDLKWTQGVRYFLCTDLKRCPEWVTGGQIEYLEASQLRSFCWQRPWSSERGQGAPVELEGSSMPIGGELDGETRRPERQMNDGATMINSDIHRISEKIDSMHLSRNPSMMNSRREYERRIDNEKIKREDVGMVKRPDQSYRLTESAYVDRPLVPMRSPMRSPLRSPTLPPGMELNLPRGNAFNEQYYPTEEKSGWV